MIVGEIIEPSKDPVAGPAASETVRGDAATRALFAGGRCSEVSSSATASSEAGDKRLSSAIEVLRAALELFGSGATQSVDAVDPLRWSVGSCGNSEGE